MSKTKQPEKASNVVWTANDVATMLTRNPAIVRMSDLTQLRDALLKAQMALPKARRRNMHSIYMSLRTSTRKLHKMIAATHAMMEQGAAPAAAPAEPVAAVADDGKVHRYSLIHFRALAHDPAVKPLLDSKVLTDRHTLASAVMLAQSRNIPPECWRTHQSIIHSTYSKGKDKSENGLLANLRNAMRYPPLSAPLVEPPPQSEPVHEEPAPQPAEPSFTLKPEANAQLSVLMMQGMRVLAASIVESLQPVIHQAFQSTLMEALPAMLDAHARTVNMKMQSTIVEMLGGPSEVKKEEPVVPVLEVVKTKPDRLAIDVVGLTGPSVDIVTQAFRDVAHLDLRFINNGNTTTMVYRPNVVLVKKFVSHAAEARVRSQATRLIKVTGAAHAVITAVQTMVEQPALH